MLKPVLSLRRISSFTARRAQAREAVVAKLWGGEMPQRGSAMSGFVVGIAVAALIVAILIPIAFSQFFAVVTTSWDPQTILLWGIVPLVIILALVLFFLNKADDQA